MVGADTLVRRRSRGSHPLLAPLMLVIVLGGLWGREVRANGQGQLPGPSVSSESLVIQGRITGMEGVLTTVKTPDGYPGGPGGHAQFVTVGPSFRVDISRARVLLPDGRQTDKSPLTVGDRVLMVLSTPDSASSAPAGPTNANPIYFASTIERVVQSDKIVNH
jgi:hypothetical protein